MRRFFLIFILAASSLSLRAQGTDALPFIRIDRNPVTSAMAGAGSASDGAAAYAAFSNASILPLAGGRGDAAVSYQSWMPSALSKSTNFQGGASFKVSSRVAVALGYAHQLGTAYEAFDNTGLSIGTFTPKDHLAALGVGIGLGERLALGVNARYALQQVAEGERLSGISGDVFLAFQARENLRVTAGIAALGTQVQSKIGRKFDQPGSFKAAADWTLRFAETHTLDLMADADYYFNEALGLSAGLQYAWNDIVFLRGGYRLASKECVIPSHAGVGAGIKFAGFHVDASYLMASSVLGNTFSVGLGYSF